MLKDSESNKFWKQSTYIHCIKYTENCTVALNKTRKALEKDKLQQQGKLHRIPFHNFPSTLGLDSPCKYSLLNEATLLTPVQART